MIAQSVLLLAIAGAAAGVTILDDPITTATGWTLASATHLGADTRCDGGSGGCLLVSPGGTATKAHAVATHANVKVQRRAVLLSRRLMVSPRRCSPSPPPPLMGASPGKR
eukprot:m.332386 g.332386  ORF g.332386 m.332386 type:complete len:110 (+) comp16515_c1_seq9:201-530(+)